MPISGCIGPRGDGYDPGRIMSEAEAEDYHGGQAQVFATTAADMVTAITMTNINEAVGLTRAAKAAGMPVAISFTVETDGRLPSGELLREAIESVDTNTGSTPPITWSIAPTQPISIPRWSRRTGPNAFAAFAPMPPSQSCRT